VDDEEAKGVLAIVEEARADFDEARELVMLFYRRSLSVKICVGQYDSVPRDQYILSTPS
jgi:hypothetical protein